MIYVNIKQGEAETYDKRYTKREISKSALASKQDNKPVKNK